MSSSSTCAMRRFDNIRLFHDMFLLTIRISARLGVVVRQYSQNSPTFYSSAQYTQRIWDIQNRRHIRAPQREEVTDDGTDYEVHRESAICHSRCRCDATSFSLSLSRAFFFAHHERRRRLRARWWWSRSFSLFFFFSLSSPVE